jgi:hypothetical protein
MSTKGTILDNLKTALEAIKKTTYDTTVQRVERYPLPFDINSVDTPFIAILEETKTNQDGDTNTLHTMKVHLYAFVHDTDDPVNSMDEFVDDIENMINAPVDLGTYCLDVYNSDTDRVLISETQNISASELILEILFYSTKGSA